ncbi:MAG: alpha/beta hydrolase [Eubacteriales bacterium]|nr:alpha/beta hydrolase [Eubacteriales bacterium]
MIWKEYGPPEAPKVLLIHELGTGEWMWQGHIDALSGRYRVLTPTISGCAEDWDSPFPGCEEEAESMLERCTGHLAALCGVGLGAQLAAIMLCRSPGLTELALLDSPNVLPMQSGMERMQLPLRWLPLLRRSQGFALQCARSWDRPAAEKEIYAQQQSRVTRENWLAMRSAFAGFALWDSFADCTARVYASAGREEPLYALRSAGVLAAMAANGSVDTFEECPVPAALCLPRMHLARLRDLLEKKEKENEPDGFETGKQGYTLNENNSR